MTDMCTDGRFEIIAKAKEKLIHSTNITEKELKVADEFLYRCWQMGWIDSDYEIKEYDVGNGRKLLVNYSDRGIARVTKQFIEQAMIPKFEKDEKYSWHDLKADQTDVPEEDSRVLMRVDNKLNQYVCVTYHDGNFGLFARYVVLGWAYIPPFEGENDIPSSENIKTVRRRSGSRKQAV